MRILSVRPLHAQHLATLVDQVANLDLAADQLDISTSDILHTQIKALKKQVKALRTELLKCVTPVDLPELILLGFENTANDKLSYARACTQYTEVQLENEYEELVAVGIARALVQYFRPKFNVRQWENFLSKHSLS